MWGSGVAGKATILLSIELLSISVLIGGRGVEKAPNYDHMVCVMCIWHYIEIFEVVT